MFKPKKLLSSLAKTSDFFADVLFPIRCINCGKDGMFICEKCLQTIPKNSFQVCAICERTILPNGDVCNHCRQNHGTFPLNRLFVVSDYKDPLLSKAIHFLKYKFVSELATPLGDLAVQTILRLSSFPSPDFIIPVPLHNKRLRWRGFNQSTLLAEVLANKLLPGIQIELLENAISRSKFTQPQMKVRNYTAREKNIAGCFNVNEDLREKITAKRIMLVDDVCTTGSTLNECAKELRKLNPKSISAVVLARQS